MTQVVLLSFGIPVALGFLAAWVVVQRYFHAESALARWALVIVYAVVFVGVVFTLDGPIQLAAMRYGDGPVAMFFIGWSAAGLGKVLVDVADQQRGWHAASPRPPATDSRTSTATAPLAGSAPPSADCAPARSDRPRLIHSG